MAERSHLRAWKEINQYKLGQCHGGLRRWTTAERVSGFGSSVPLTERAVDQWCKQQSHPFTFFFRFSSLAFFYGALLQHITIIRHSSLVSLSLPLLISLSALLQSSSPKFNYSPLKLLNLLHPLLEQ